MLEAATFLGAGEKVNEMHMLQLMVGVTREDRIRQCRKKPRKNPRKKATMIKTFGEGRRNVAICIAWKVKQLKNEGKGGQRTFGKEEYQEI